MFQKILKAIFVISLKSFYQIPLTWSKYYTYPPLLEKDLMFFSCVLKEACLTDDLTAHRNYGADCDYDMDYDYDFDALIRESAEQSTCPDKEMVCCHELNKKEVPDEEKSYDYEINLKCYEFRKEGYR